MKITEKPRGYIVLIKVGLALAGLKILTEKVPPAPNWAFHEGQIEFKVFAGLLLLIAAIPWRGPKSASSENSSEL